MKVLCVNTYAGSLLLGASAFGADIIGSYEDCGFGQEIAKANFPSLEHIADDKDWPAQDLRDVVVLAHPPCSAFSVQNSSWRARGTDAAAFACTRRVLDYAMTNRAAAIAVESVLGALGGAWDVHSAYAREHGYRLYRVLQNGCSFGPQWRERFWAVYLRNDVAPKTMAWRLSPTWTPVREAVKGHTDGPSFRANDEALAKLKAKFKEVGVSDEDTSFFFDKQDPPHRGTGIVKIIQERLYKDWEVIDLSRKFDLLYSSSQLCYLNPNSTASVLLGGTWWYYEGRNLSMNAYKVIQGFPANYVFPKTGRRDYTDAMRTFLSKGVIPQVATWIVCNISRNLNLEKTDHSCHACKPGPAYEIVSEPGHIIDFRFRKSQWMKEELPELRHYYEPEVYA